MGGRVKMPVCEWTTSFLLRKGNFDIMWPSWAYLQALITA